MADQSSQHPAARARRPLRLCVGASAGGHMTQLLKLAPCWADQDSFFVTTLDLVAAPLRPHGPVYVIGECNRERPWRILGVLWRAFRVVWRERPDVVLTTGSLPLALVCLAAKLRGAKVIWIDSVTNVARLSMSGRFVRPFADLCLTQWPHLASARARIEYAGELV